MVSYTGSDAFSLPFDSVDTYHLVNSSSSEVGEFLSNGSDDDQIIISGTGKDAVYPNDTWYIGYDVTMNDGVSDIIRVNLRDFTTGTTLRREVLTRPGNPGQVSVQMVLSGQDIGASTGGSQVGLRLNHKSGSNDIFYNYTFTAFRIATHVDGSTEFRELAAGTDGLQQQFDP